MHICLVNRGERQVLGAFCLTVTCQKHVKRVYSWIGNHPRHVEGGMKVLVFSTDQSISAILRQRHVIVEQPTPNDVNLSDVGDMLSWLSIEGLYDAVVLRLLRDNNLELVKALRRKGIGLPVVALREKHNYCEWLEDHIEFLKHGGDYSLPNPPDPQKFIAMLHVVTRRAKGRFTDFVEFRSDGMVMKIDIITRMVLVNDLSLRLSRKQLDLVLCLAESPGRFFSRTKLINLIYENRNAPGPFAITTILYNIRRKLDKLCPGASVFIQTVSGVGHRLRR